MNHIRKPQIRQGIEGKNMVKTVPNWKLGACLKTTKETKLYLYIQTPKDTLRFTNSNPTCIQEPIFKPPQNIKLNKGLTNF